MNEFLRWLFIVFFATHIPVTLLVDSQVIFPSTWFPDFAIDMLKSYIRDYKDPLVRELLASLSVYRPSTSS